MDAISLTIVAGQRIALEGPAGSGKSLLLRALALLDPVDTGTIRWRGAEVADSDVPAYRRSVAYLAQSPALVEGTVETNLKLPFSLAAHRRQSYDGTRCLDLLRQLGRDGTFMAQPVETLSGGERQITALVRLLQLEPDVLLLDEPTAALDPVTTSLAERLIREWVEVDASGRAYAWVSHDAQQARTVSDRRLRMNRGTLTEVA